VSNRRHHLNWLYLMGVSFDMCVLMVLSGCVVYSITLILIMRKDTNGSLRSQMFFVGDGKLEW